MSDSSNTAPGGARTSLYVEDASFWRETLDLATTLDRDLDVRMVDGGVILPARAAPRGTHHRLQGGVVDAHGTFVTGHLVDTKAPGAPRNIVSSYEVPEDVEHLSETVIYGGGRDARHFGHYIIENLARLWWVAEGAAGERLRVVFIDSGMTADHHNVELLLMMGIQREDIVFLDKPTRFDTVIVPEQSMYLSRGDTHLRHTKALFDSIKSSVVPGGIDKIYLTRRQLTEKGRVRTVNEIMIEDFYASQGYEIIAPETLPLREQVSLLSGARELASPAGTLSHLVAFAPDHVKLAIVLRDKRERMPIQWALNTMRHARASIVDCLRPPLPVDHRAGVHYFMPTAHWKRYALEQHGTEFRGAPPADVVYDFICQWVDLVRSANPRELKFIPAWTVTDFLESLSAFVCNDPLTPEELARVTQRFGRSSDLWGFSGQ